MTEYTLVKLWKKTINHEYRFSNYVKTMALDICSDGDIIANNIADIILNFTNRAPTYQQSHEYINDELKHTILIYIFEWWNMYKSNIKPDPFWAT